MNTPKHPSCDVLPPKLVSGELRVKDPERFIREVCA